MKLFKKMKKISIGIALVILSTGHITNSVVALTEFQPEIDEATDKELVDSKLVNFPNTDGAPQIEPTTETSELDALSQEIEDNETSVPQQSATSDSVDAEITVITAEPVPQTAWLGSDLSEFDLWDFVMNIKDQDGNKIDQDQLSIELMTRPNTNRITEGNSAQFAKVEITSKETSANLQVSIPFEVIWGETLMYGGLSVGSIYEVPYRTAFALTIHQKDNNLFLVSNTGNGIAPTNNLHSHFPGNFLGFKAYRPIEDRSILDSKLQYYEYAANGTTTVNQTVDSFGVNQKIDVQNGDIVQMTSAEIGDKNGHFTSTTDTWTAGNSPKASYEIVNQSFRRLNLDLLGKLPKIQLWENNTVEEANQKINSAMEGSGFDNIEVSFVTLPDLSQVASNREAIVQVEETLYSGKKVSTEMTVLIDVVTVELKTTLNNQAIEIGDEFQVKHTIMNYSLGTFNDLQIEGSIFQGREAVLVANSLEIVYPNRSIEPINSINSDGKFQLEISNLAGLATIEIRYRMKAMEVVNEEAAQEVTVRVDAQQFSNTTPLKINDGKLMFSNVPDVLEFNETKLKPSMVNEVVERKDSDWGIEVRDTRSTKNNTNEDAVKQDWYVTARAQTFFETVDGKFTVPPSYMFIGFITPTGTNLNISENTAQISEKQLISEADYGERFTNLEWEADKGINLNIVDSHSIVSGKTYKNRVEFNLIVAP